jgi:ferredoxin-type protein NapH
MKKKIQLVTKIAFLTIFIFLIVTSRIQLWVGLFLVGVAASLLLGRVYCGWACPINTVMDGVTWLKKKLHIKGLKTPQLIRKPWIRYLVLGLFIAAFIMTIVTGKKIPALPALFAAGIILTFFFPGELWHRYLCPYGTILSLPASKAKYSMSIDQENCNSCGACIQSCPGEAFEKKQKQYTIKKGDCLVCLDCSIKCSQDTISYT